LKYIINRLSNSFL